MGEGEDDEQEHFFVVVEYGLCFGLLGQFPRLILLMDGDLAGREATRRLHQTLLNNTEVLPVFLPPDHDPDDLTDLELNTLLHPLFLL